MGLFGSAGNLLAGKLFGSDPKSMMENQQAFTEKMMQNKHQWEVDDLRAAGLNPILSATKGPPAIGGSGSASSMASSGNDLLTMAQIKNVEANTKLTNAKAAKESVTQSVYEEGKGVIDKVIDAVKTPFQPNTGKTNSLDAIPLASNVPSNSARSVKEVKKSASKVADKLARPGTKFNKALKWLFKGDVKPLVTTYPDKKPQPKVKTSNKQKADSYRKFMKENPDYRKKRTNKQKADSYREYLRKNPRR